MDSKTDLALPRCKRVEYSFKGKTYMVSLELLSPSERYLYKEVDYTPVVPTGRR